MLKDERESQKTTLLSKWESNRRKNIKNIKATSKNDTVGIHPSIALERITSRKLREPDEDTPAAIFKMDFQMQRNGAKITGKVEKVIAVRTMLVTYLGEMIGDKFEMVTDLQTVE